MASLHILPNELLDHVFSLLDDDNNDDNLNSPPSVQSLRQLPSHGITSSAISPLKNLCRVSARCLAVARPRLFRHARYELRDQDRFLAFVVRDTDLARHVRTVVVCVRSIFRGSERSNWWRGLFAQPHLLDPDAVTVVAPPYMFADMAPRCGGLEETDSWAFHLPLQIMHFRQPTPRPRPRPKPPPADNGQGQDKHAVVAGQGDDATREEEEEEDFLLSRPWTEILFNEGSSLHAYSTYEYYLMHPPSVMVRWGSVDPLQSSLTELPYPASAIARLTSFCYTAIFPFYNHTNLVLKVVRNMTSLRHLGMQLAPGPGCTVFEEEQQTGVLDPNDPWMELETSYSLISHSVRYLGVQGRLEEFHTYDFQLPALRESLSEKLARVLGERWVHDGNGLWRRVANDDDVDS